VNQKLTCERFQDYLDLRAAGQLDEQGHAALKSHAVGCPDCALLLRVQEALALPPPVELEARVPDELVTGMWARVEAALPAPAVPAAKTWAPWVGRHRRRAAERTGSPGPSSGLLAPLLAAAVVLLALLSGFLWGEVHQLRQREGRLAGELARQDRLVNGFLQLASGIIAERGPWTPLPAGESWERGLRHHEAPTLGELTELLGQLPPETTLMSAPDAEAFFWKRLAWKSLVSHDESAPVVMDDGLQAAEALAILRSLRLTPEAKIPARWWTTLTEADLAVVRFADASRPALHRTPAIHEERKP
jgi:hypothetical protein